MKKLIFFLICNFMVFSFCYSQDYLVKRTGDSIKVKIVAIGLTEVKYKEYENLIGITYGILKSEVLRIRYENGRIELFNEPEQVPELSAEEKCSCGRSDASSYHGKKGTHVILGFFFGPFSMLGTALIPQTPKKGRRTTSMSQHKYLFKDSAYLKCYKKTAKFDLLEMEGWGWAALLIITLVDINK